MLFYNLGCKQRSSIMLVVEHFQRMSLVCTTNYYIGNSYYFSLAYTHDKNIPKSSVFIEKYSNIF